MVSLPPPMVKLDVPLPSTFGICLEMYLKTINIYYLILIGGCSIVTNEGTQMFLWIYLRYIQKLWWILSLEYGLDCLVHPMKILVVIIKFLAGKGHLGLVCWLDLLVLMVTSVPSDIFFNEMLENTLTS